MSELALAIPANTEVAKLKVAAYRALRKERGHLDLREGTAMRAYEAVAKGLKVIELYGAIAGGGWDALGRPRLAIARADEQFIQVREEGRGGSAHRLIFTPDGWKRPKGEAMLPRSLSLPMSEMPAQVVTVPRAQAAIPTMPPELRNKHDRALKNYHILFEAVWQGLPEPADPYLLKYLGGSLFAVLGEWDITDFEAYAMRGLVA